MDVDARKTPPGRSALGWVACILGPATGLGVISALQGAQEHDRHLPIDWLTWFGVGFVLGAVVAAGFFISLAVARAVLARARERRSR